MNKATQKSRTCFSRERERESARAMIKRERERETLLGNKLWREPVASFSLLHSRIPYPCLHLNSICFD